MKRSKLRLPTHGLCQAKLRPEGERGLCVKAAVGQGRKAVADIEKVKLGFVLPVFCSMISRIGADIGRICKEEDSVEYKI